MGSVVKISGVGYQKSSFSSGGSCVGVAVDDDKIRVINTNEGKNTVEFSAGEWAAFIAGVKNGEFDSLP